MSQMNTKQTGGFWGDLGGATVDFLDDYGGAYIRDRFKENATEHGEGPTEFGNPGTAPQPVYHSETAGGQPLNTIANRLGISSQYLALGIGAIGAILFIKFLR